MTRDHTFQLRVGPDPTGAAASVVDVWDGFDVVQDVFDPGTPFQFGFWNSENRGTTWLDLRRIIKVGCAVNLRIDDALVLSGWIDRLEEKVDRQGGAQVFISGHDTVIKAKDWDADPAISFMGLTLDSALERLFAPLGVEVIIGARADIARQIQSGELRTTAHRHTATRRRRHTRVDRSHPRAGERIWTVAESMVRRAGLWMWSCPDEGLGTMALVVDGYDYKSDSGFVFTREYAAGEMGSYVGNMLGSDHVITTKNMPTAVRVFGHCGRGDKYSFQYGVLHPAPGTTNDLLTQDRVTASRIADPHPVQQRYIKSQRARTYEESNQEAEWVYARAMRGVRTYTATMAGTGQMVNGHFRLYHPNTTAYVSDAVTGIGEQMFIHRVHFKSRRDSSGTTTTVTMIPLSAVQLTIGAERNADT